MNPELISALQSVCPPKCEVEILPTKRRGKIELVVVKYPPEIITLRHDIGDWAIMEIHPLHHNKVRPLLEPAGAYRALYCCGSNFVFYTPFGGVFRKFMERLHYDGYGDREYQKYVGFCPNIETLIAYITSVEGVLF